MSYSFNHKSESGVVGTGSYIFRHYGSDRPLSTTLYYKIASNTLYLRSDNPGGYTDGSTALTATGYNDIPWFIDDTEASWSVVFENTIKPNSCANWFAPHSGGGRVKISGFTNIDYLDTSECENMSHMFYNCRITTLDLSYFDTSSVTDMSFMFAQQNYVISSITSYDLTNFDTSNVTDMARMFWNNYYLTYIDLSSFDMTGVDIYHGQYMFYQCPNVQTAYCKDAANKAILDRICADCGVSWRFTVKS